ncbi:PREDICTED: myrosinase 1 [Eufriesea mexicana]|uniref:myrosinase 1 n=1 Tax=Eufriesea mexicana TaxID=516756 RepID=UPI00083BEF4E|nr:PREDICTED: myrosinase 1 [Eufriesea mexicana]XP_017755065.1 PREDICTED: myrosinase 1 [Eufriesea mexicana]
MFATCSLGFGVVFLLVISASGESAEQNLQFPPNFLLGVATAAYQIEGAWNVSDKTESTWDRFSHYQNGAIYNNHTGDIATDSYNKYKEDIAILKKLGFKAYRFSVSWPRILPTGYSNYVSKDGVRFYHDFIDELLANNIEPMLTIYHWDHPQVLEDAGGWLNSEMVDWFADYARVVFREYAPKVKMFIPINEPSAVCKNSYSHGIYAPGKTLNGFGEYLCTHNVIKAHAKAYRIYEAEFKETYKGIIAGMPRSHTDIDAVENYFQFNAGWTMHPIYSKDGDYPPLMKSLVANKSMEQGYSKSRLPTFTSEWVTYIRGTSDFLAVNHYTTRLVTAGSMGKVPSHENDQGVKEIVDTLWKPAASTWLKVVPEGFRFVLRQLAENYGNPPMYITENGVSDFGALNDDDRINYYREYLKQMLNAIYNDGVNIRGYILWSLLDNFEWNMGYHERFGIVSVDFNDPQRPRTLKKSASWWQSIIASGKVE